MSDIKDLAYQMQEAYNNFKTQGEAIEYVKDRNSHADLNILWSMWSAIDTYVSLNVKELKSKIKELESLVDRCECKVSNEREETELYKQIQNITKTLS